MKGTPQPTKVAAVYVNTSIWAHMIRFEKDFHERFGYRQGAQRKQINFL